jgi:hypothetical protein
MDDAMAQQLTLLVQSWPGGPWSWDGRFATAGSSFALALEPKARESAMHALTRGWTVKTLDQAPVSLRAICTRTGGLRAGQRLLAGTSDELFGLWWPWSGGATITLRIGIAGASPETTKSFRALFRL